jgi:hypothetical protein
MGQKSDQLIALLDHVKGEIESFYDSLPEAERAANGTWDVWSPKDALAHLTFWQNNLIEIFNTLEQTPPEQAPFEERNHANYLRYQNSPWSDVHAAFADSLDEIVVRTKQYSDEELTEFGRFPRLPNNSLQGSIMGNTFTHALTHLAELVTKKGDEERGFALQEDGMNMLVEFDPSPRTKGVAYYNLACAYALSGRVERAVELLKQSFPLRPDLVEFSKQDSDFNKVRDLPEFQALYS